MSDRNTEISCTRRVLNLWRQVQEGRLVDDDMVSELNELVFLSLEQEGTLYVALMREVIIKYGDHGSEKHKEGGSE